MGERKQKINQWQRSQERREKETRGQVESTKIIWLLLVQDRRHGSAREKLRTLHEYNSLVNWKP